MSLRRRALLGSATALLLAACAGTNGPADSQRAAAASAAAPGARPDTRPDAPAHAPADAPPEPQPSAGPTPEPAEGLLWRIDPAASLLQVLAFRQGALAGLGHNHVLTAPRLQGWLQLPADAPDPTRLSPAQLARTRFALALRLEDVALDEPARRAQLGPAFASRPDAQAIAGTRANLLGPAMLDAARHPWLRVQSAMLRGEGAQVLAEVEIDWHGQQRRWRLPLALAMAPSAEGQVLRVQGQMALRLTDFGIQPLSLLGGMLAVQDDIGVTLDLVLRPR